jgi:hypothetical protein
MKYQNLIFIISNFRRLIFLECFIFQSVFNNENTLTNTYGRISNIDNKNIYVSSSLNIADCIRQCVDFSINHLEYIFEDCFAYNYDMKKCTCELIHSIEPLEYTINFQTQWMTGFKYNS